MTFPVPEAIRARVFAHCESAYPEEACGILVGPEMGAPDAVFPCANIQNALHAADPAQHPRDARTAYRVDPADLFAVTRAIRGDGRVFKAIFHSHADVGAYFSDEDQRQAAPRLTLSIPAFARGEGLPEADVRARVAAGTLDGDLAVDKVSARMPTYPELVYLVVDVTRGRARGWRGFFWDDAARGYTAIALTDGNGDG